jgi:hypothetical protein
MLVYANDHAAIESNPFPIDLAAPAGERPAAFVIDGLLPEGVSVLTGRPKTGKSSLALSLAVAVARGGVALGNFQAAAGEALYLSLTDHESRVRRRLQRLCSAAAAPAAGPGRLFLCHSWAPIALDESDAGRVTLGCQRLEYWLDEHPETRLVVIDPLAAILPPEQRTSSLAAQLAPLFYTAGAHPGLAVLLGRGASPAKRFCPCAAAISRTARCRCNARMARGPRWARPNNSPWAQISWRSSPCFARLGRTPARRRTSFVKPGSNASGSTDFSPACGTMALPSVLTMASGRQPIGLPRRKMAKNEKVAKNANICNTCNTCNTWH